MRAAGPVRVPGPGGGPSPAARRGLRRARPSFAEEPLFGSAAGPRPAPPASPSPRAAPGGSRPGTGRRLRRSSPSFCDESLFGAKPEGPARAAPGMRKEDVFKLYSLLWTPPPDPRDRPSRSPCSGPLRAIHSSPATANFEAGREGKSCVWKHPGSSPGCEGQGAPSRGRSQSLSRLNTPSKGLHMAPDSLRAEKCRKQSSPTAPLMRVRSHSTSRSPLAMNSKAEGGCKPRPPWK